MAIAVELVPYDPRWPEDFERISDKLQRLLAPYVMAIVTPPKSVTSSTQS